MHNLSGPGLAALLLLFAASTGTRATVQQMTPVLLAVHDAPVPFPGSDERTHLVYELWITNFSSAGATIKKLEVRGDGNAILETLDQAAVSRRLQPAGERESAVTIAKGARALLFVHLTLSAGTSVPRQLSHRVEVYAAAAPPGQQEFSEEGGRTTVDLRPVAKIGPPLVGDKYVSADSCCDASRHTRAALPINGRVFVAQRYAVDWEQLNASNRIYSGPKEKPASYTIYGKPVFAVADAVVASVITGLPEQTPGKYPTNISPDEADGNAVILDLGQHRYALYAHMQSESIHLKPGDRVRRGEVIGRVGNSGNSVAPHLHFQLMDGLLSLASNGLPYAIDTFEVTGATSGTKAFDTAEANGTPLVFKPIAPPKLVKNALPLDQLVISFR